MEIQVLGIKRKITVYFCADSCVAAGMIWASNIKNPKVDISVVSRGKQVRFTRTQARFVSLLCCPLPSDELRVVKL